jgi:hypothetical protein
VKKEKLVKLAAQGCLALLAAAALVFPGRAEAQEEIAGERIVSESPTPIADPAMMGEPIWDQGFDGEEYYGDDSPAPIASTEAWVQRGLWYTQQDVVVLGRARNQKRFLSIKPSASTGLVGDEIMTTASATLGFAPGTRLTLGRLLGSDDRNRDYSMEFTFYGLFEFNGASQLNSTPGSNENQIRLVPDINYPGYNFAQYHQAHYEADLNSYEFNFFRTDRLGRDRMLMSPDGSWVREANPRFTNTFLLGIRYVRVNEGYQFISRGVNPAILAGDYYVRTHNDVLGPQFGYDFSSQHTFWRFGVLGKIAGMVNFADQNSYVHIVDTDAPPDRFEHAAKENLVLMLETNVHAEYMLRTNCKLRASWDMLFLQGIATAGSQVTFNPVSPPQLKTSDFMLATGLSFGFELCW